MEKFYIVEKESKLYGDYHDWIENTNNLNVVFKKFLDDVGLETTQYVPSTDSIMIIPTDNDIEKFGKEITKQTMEHGLRRFKMNSKTNKLWIKTAEENELDGNMRKPFVPSYFAVSGKTSSILFEEDGLLYCSMSANCDFKDPECMIRISDIEFEKVL